MKYFICEVLILLIDMPLEKLRVYTGSNPCPKDIDAYWDAALADMRALEPAAELIPARFQPPGAECFDLYFTGVGGARVHAKYLRPKGAGRRPAVLQFHGYTGDCGNWSSKLAFTGAGFVVAALDCRGQGGSSEDNLSVKGNTFRGHIIRGLDNADPRDMAFQRIFLDTAMLARVVMDMPEVDEGRMGAMGGSQGGGLTLACAALEPRVQRLAPVYPFLCDYKRVWEMDLAKGAYEELCTYFRQFDPLHAREEEIFTKLGYIDVQHIAKRIRGEVLMATGLMDTICPPSTQFAAYNKITSRKDVKIYPDFGHEGLPQFDDMAFEFMLGL